MRITSPRVLIALQLAAFWPVWGWYATRIFDGSDEPWGVTALITVVLVLLRDRQRKEVDTTLLRCSLVPLICYVVGYQYLPALARAGLAVVALGLSIGALLVERRTLPAIVALLLLSLPLIASLQFYGGFPVRLITANLSAMIIRLTGFPVTASGTCLEWLGEVVAIDAPCAGIRMLWSGLYLHFTVAAFNRLAFRQIWLGYLLSMAAIFSGNLLRATFLFYSESGIIKIPSWGHQAVGIVSFILVATVILQVHQCLKRGVA